MACLDRFLFTYIYIATYIQKPTYVHVCQGHLFYGGCPLDVLFLSQQLTNLAAMFVHCCTSPSRYGSFSMCDKFSNSVWVFENCGK